LVPFVFVLFEVGVKLEYVTAVLYVFSTSKVFVIQTDFVSDLFLVLDNIELWHYSRMLGEFTLSYLEKFLNGVLASLADRTVH